MGINMDMEEIYFEESSTKQIFIKSLIIIFILGFCFGAFFYYKSKNTIKLRNIEVELGEPLSKNVLDYLSNGEKYSSKYKLYLDDVNTNKVGKYQYKVRYNKHTVTGYITILDRTKPEVTVNDITIGKDEELHAMYLVSTCKDKALPCSAIFEDERIYKKIKTPGTYNTIIKVSDANGNYVKKDVTITSSKNKTFSSVMTNDLDYYSNSLEDETIEKKYFKKLDKAINEDTIEYEELIQTISAEDFELYSEKALKETKLITVYNKYGYVIGIQVMLTYTDNTSEMIENKIRDEQ